VNESIKYNHSLSHASSVLYIHSLPLVSMSKKQGADELANFGLNEAIGCHVSAQDLAASCLGDVAQDVADPLAKHMDKKESNNANIKPKNTNPRSPKAPESYDNHSRSTHIHPTYNPDDDIAQQYQKMMDDNWDQQISSIEDGTSELNYNTYASGSASLNREPRALASDMQQVQNTGHGWEDWISQELYTHENSNIAKGILAVFDGLNSNTAHMIMHGLAPDHAMNPIVALREAYSKIDPITGHSVTEGQAYTDAAIAAATFAFGGEFDSIANKVIHGVDSLIAGTSSVAKNWASMFGSREVNALSPMRLRVMDNIVKSQAGNEATEFTGANVRTIAAAHVREARNLLRDSGLNAADRNDVLRSFDLETFRVEHVVEQKQIYRAFDDFDAKMFGRYTSENLLENQTRRIVDFALPNNSATRLAIVEVPQGATIFSGRVAQQFGLRGGAQQTFLTGPLDQYMFQETMMPREIYTPRGMANAY